MAGGAVLPTWPQIAHAGEQWAAPRRPHDVDVQMVFYRDANSWCPFCNRVWFLLEAKGLRYATERIHLQGDRAEPPKQAWYRELVPSGCVPALRIRDEIVPDSLDILYRLEEEFPEPRMLPDGEDDHVWKLCEMSMAFNTDGSDWLHNTKPHEEEKYHEDMLQRLRWLEQALMARGGPFFCGVRPSIAEAAYVGFLTRLAHCALYFKRLDIRDPATFPRIAAWFSAMEQLPAYQFTKQDADFEQRIYQAHPDRRAGAESCMQLGRTGSCVGEPDCRIQPELPVASLVAGGMAALEAASKLSDRHGLVVRFLIRKHAGLGSGDDEAVFSAADVQLRAVAAVLAGIAEPAFAIHAAGGVAAFKAGPIGNLGELIGTPRDMSSAAAAQVRGALHVLMAVVDTVANVVVPSSWTAVD